MIISKSVNFHSIIGFFLQFVYFPKGKTNDWVGNVYLKTDMKGGEKSNSDFNLFEINLEERCGLCQHKIYLSSQIFLHIMWKKKLDSSVGHQSLGLAAVARIRRACVLLEK